MSTFLSAVESSLSCYPIHDEEWPRLAVCGEFEKSTDFDVQHVTLEVLLRGKRGQVLQLAEAFVETTFYQNKSPFKVDCDYNPQYVAEIDSIEIRVIRCDVLLENSPTRTFLSAEPLTMPLGDEGFDDGDDDLDDNNFNNGDLH